MPSEHRFTSATALFAALAIASCGASAVPRPHPIVRLAPNCTGVGHIYWPSGVDETLCLDDDIQQEVIARAMRRGAPTR